MNNFLDARVVRFCSIPYEVDTEAGLVVACRNESIGQVSLEVDGFPVELEICGYHVEKYGLKDEGPFPLDKAP